jgi:hypothetical protein
MDKDQLDYGLDGETTGMFDYDKAYVTASIDNWIHTNLPVQCPKNPCSHVRVECHQEIAAQVVSGAIMYMAEFVPSAAHSGPKLKDSILDGCALHCVNLHICLKSTCPCKAKQGSAFNAEWILDSGASAHFTPYLSDFTTINKKNFGNVRMAGKNALLAIKGKGTVLIQHKIHDSRTGTCKMSITSLEPVFFVPGMNDQLMSSRQLLQTGLQSKSDRNGTVFKDESGLPILSAHVKSILQPTVQIVSTRIVHLLPESKVAQRPDYHLWHQRFCHPSNRILSHVEDTCIDGPKVTPPLKTPVCPGCAQGKMHQKPFSENPKCATEVIETRPFGPV